jgi:hypothetical protein
MNYSRENPPPGATHITIPQAVLMFAREHSNGALDFAYSDGAWFSASHDWKPGDIDDPEETNVWQRIALTALDPNEAMLRRDGQPLPAPTPAAPYMVQAPRSGDGLLTLAVFGKRNVWGAEQ